MLKLSGVLGKVVACLDAEWVLSHVSDRGVGAIHLSDGTVIKIRAAATRKQQSIKFNVHKRDRGCKRCNTKLAYFSMVEHDGHKHIHPIGIDGEGNHVQLTIDHVIPKSKGGPNISENLMTLCFKCNSEKGNAPTQHDKTKVYELNKLRDLIIGRISDAEERRKYIEKHKEIMKRRYTSKGLVDHPSRVRKVKDYLDDLGDAMPTIDFNKIKFEKAAKTVPVLDR